MYWMCGCLSGSFCLNGDLQVLNRLHTRLGRDGYTEISVLRLLICFGVFKLVGGVAWRHSIGSLLS